MPTKLQEAVTAAEGTDRQLKILDMETPLESNNELAPTQSKAPWQAVLSE